MNPLWSSDLNPMIHEPALKFRSKSKNLWTPSKFQIKNSIGFNWSVFKHHFGTQWFNWFSFEKLCFTHHYTCFLKSWQAISNCSFELLFAWESLEMNDQTHEIEFEPERFQCKWINWISLSVCLYKFLIWTCAFHVSTCSQLQQNKHFSNAQHSTPIRTK